MNYICYECFIAPLGDAADATPADGQLIACPRDPHYWAVKETHLRCRCCGNCVVVDLHVRRWYAAAATGPRQQLA